MAGSQAPLLYAISILVVFLCLAALYESWTDPFFRPAGDSAWGSSAALLATTLRGLPNDVYFQIGLLTIIGLSTKNAILIVQFAKDQVEEGVGLIEATLEGGAAPAATDRDDLPGLRPRGAAAGPGSGAGAGAQNAIGTGVLGGVVTATFLVTIFAPLFYVMIYKALGKHRKRVTMKHTAENVQGGQ